MRIKIIMKQILVGSKIVRKYEHIKTMIQILNQNGVFIKYFRFSKKTQAFKIILKRQAIIYKMSERYEVERGQNRKTLLIKTLEDYKNVLKYLLVNKQNESFIIIEYTAYNSKTNKLKLYNQFNNMSKKLDIQAMIQMVSQCRPVPLHQLKMLCQKAKQVLSKQQNIIHVPAPVKICGDIHGQFPDLLQIFQLGGNIQGNRYLFLGDYVDRGYYSIQTFTYLIALKVKYPSNLSLLRGNHESRGVTKDYGFYDECMQKYNDVEAYNAFISVFQYLPLAAIVENKFLCMHGGLSPHLLNVDDILKIDRVQEVPADGILTDLLWSDPAERVGFSMNTQRGAGQFYGSDVTNQFLQRNRLRCITRAHELVMKGYQITHNQRVMTIFSAPNYCYRCKNKGAFLDMGTDLNGKFIVFQQVSEKITDESPTRIKRIPPNHFL